MRQESKDKITQTNTGWARLIRSDSSARFCFELSGIRINSVFKHTLI